jgi:ABC-type nitrate/sulfonate/bicarbonate transport system substrate-binding protein
MYNLAMKNSSNAGNVFKLNRRKFLGISTGVAVGGIVGGLIVGTIGGYLIGSATAPQRVITETRTITQAAQTVTTIVTQPTTRITTTTVTQTAPTITPIKLRIGTAVLGDYGLVAPISIAMVKGFFEKHGLDVEFSPFPGGPRGGAALIAGEIDILSTGVTDLYVLKDKGEDVRVIGNNNDGLHMTLVVAKDVNKLEDLKGKVIGVTAVGAYTWHLARAIAERMGWEVDRDVNIAALGGFDAQVAALKRGEIAAFVWGDFGAVAEALGVGKVLLTLDEIIPGKWQDQPILAKHDFVKKNPDAINRLILAYMEAWRYIRLHPDEAAMIISKKTEVPVEAVKRAMELTKISIDGRIDLTAIENMRDFLYNRGAIKTQYPAEDYIVRGFVPVIKS